MRKYIRWKFTSELQSCSALCSFSLPLACPPQTYLRFDSGVCLHYTQNLKKEEQSILNSRMAELNNIDQGWATIQSAIPTDSITLWTDPQFYRVISNNLQQVLNSFLGKVRIVYSGVKLPLEIAGKIGVLIFREQTQTVFYLNDNCDVTILVDQPSKEIQQFKANVRLVREDLCTFYSKEPIKSGQLYKLKGKSRLTKQDLFNDKWAQKQLSASIIFDRVVESQQNLITMSQWYGFSNNHSVQVSPIQIQQLALTQKLITQDLLKNFSKMFQIRFKSSRIPTRSNLLFHLTKSLKQKLSKNSVIVRLQFEVQNTPVQVDFFEKGKKIRLVSLSQKYRLSLQKLDQFLQPALKFSQEFQAAPLNDLQKQAFQLLYNQALKQLDQSNRICIKIADPTMQSHLLRILDKRVNFNLLDINDFLKSSKLNLEKIQIFLKKMLAISQQQELALVIININELVQYKQSSRKAIEKFQLILKKELRRATSKIILIVSDIVQIKNFDFKFKVVQLKSIGTQMKNKLVVKFIDTSQREIATKRIKQANFSKLIEQLKMCQFPLTEDRQAQETQKFPLLKDVFGLSQVKRRLKDMILMPLKYEQLYKKVPIKLSRSVLLKGPSGCGKTFLANALINQLNINHIQVKGPQLLDKYIGASEEAIRKVFQSAMQKSPCIIFFDQFDSIAGVRSSTSTGVTDRLVNQLLCYLDGVQQIQGIFLIAASSRSQYIDPALLRAGRIDQHLQLKDSQPQGKKEMLESYIQDTQCQLSIEEMAAQLQNYSYADIYNIFKEMRIIFAKKENPPYVISRQLWTQLTPRKEPGPVKVGRRPGSKLIQH